MNKHLWPGNGDPCLTCGWTASQENTRGLTNGGWSECPGAPTKEQLGERLTQRVDQSIEVMIGALLKELPGLSRRDIIAELVYIAGYKFKVPHS